VHLANLPENRAFFSGTIDSAGSFGGIFQSSVLAYGGIIRNPADPARFVDTSFLDALAAKGLFADQKIAIAPIRTATQGALEGDPLLSKDIRFFFEPNSSKLDLTGSGKKDNEANLAAIKKLLQMSPGSTVLLRGHVDDSMVAEFRKMGGDSMVQKKALEAAQLSKDRAEEIRRLLTEKQAVDVKRMVEAELPDVAAGRVHHVQNRYVRAAVDARHAHEAGRRREAHGRLRRRLERAHKQGRAGQEPARRGALVHAGVTAPPAAGEDVQQI